MILPLVVKCATLIALIHALRMVGRRAGPRASGLILGLPTSTAILLVLRGRDRGLDSALEMADSGLLGLIAAVVLPLAFAMAVGVGWRLPAALASAVGSYILAAIGVGTVDDAGFVARLAACCAGIASASWLSHRFVILDARATAGAPPPGWAAAVRTIVPMAYVVAMGLLTEAAGPRCAGLIGTFPGMSLLVLVVTCLEEGPATACRVARALPRANLGTLAFLAVFRLGSPALGLPCGFFLGYLAAIVNLASIELMPCSIRLRSRRSRSSGIASLRDTPGSERFGRAIRVHVRASSRHTGRLRRPHRRLFAPGLEVLPC